MIQISHECPQSLLKWAEKFNDYDYALVHLFEKYPKYFNFMKEQVNAGRRVILDNSIFELGTAFDSREYVKWINRLKPTEYIIPDALENCHKTIENCQKWLYEIPNIDHDPVLIGVVQGKTYQELVHCYQFLDEHVNKIAISFDYEYYINTSLGINKWEKYSRGRPELIQKLVKDLVWNPDKPHHLLGCSLPQEFKEYRREWETLNIETLDTSNPIQQGLLGHTYNKNGLITKHSSKLVDSTFEDEDFNKDTMYRIDYNCTAFKNMCKP